MNDKITIPSAVLDEIVEILNQKVDIPILSEAHERALFRLILSVALESLLRVQIEK